jgi:hypothetical protein
MYIYTFFLLRMSDTVTSQNINLSSWGTLYIPNVLALILSELSRQILSRHGRIANFVYSLLYLSLLALHFSSFSRPIIHPFVFLFFLLLVSVSTFCLYAASFFHLFSFSSYLIFPSFSSSFPILSLLIIFHSSSISTVRRISEIEIYFHVTIGGFWIYDRIYWTL